MSDIVLIDEFKNYDFSKKVFITGFHGVGATGYIAMRHLIEATDTVKIGYLVADSMPGYVSLENEELSLPFELFMANNFVFFLARSQLWQNEYQKFLEINEFIRVLAQFVISKNFAEAILIGGLDNKFKEADVELKTVPTKPFKNQAKSMGPFLDKGLFVAGPLALLLEHFEVKNFPACAILPYAEPEIIDPKAAAIAIKTIDQYYDFELNVDIEALYVDAKRLSEELENLLIQKREMEKTDKEIEPGTRGMYV